MTSRTISQKRSRETWSHTITSPGYYTSKIYTRYNGLHRPPTLTNQSYLSLFETSRSCCPWATVQKVQGDSTATISGFVLVCLLFFLRLNFFSNKCFLQENKVHLRLFKVQYKVQKKYRHTPAMFFSISEMNY